MNWKTIDNIKVYYIDNEKGIHHIVVTYVEFDINNNPTKNEVVFNGNKAYEILNNYVKRCGMSHSELMNLGKLYFLDYYEEKSKKTSFINNDNISQLRNKTKKNVDYRPKISNFKRWASISAIVILLAGGYKMMSRPKSVDIVHYRNPDKKVELGYDQDVVANSFRAKTVFNNLLERNQMSNKEDIEFLSNYLVNAGKTNTDYKENDSFTEFKVATMLFNASKSNRNDIINSKMGSILINLEMDYNRIFHPNSAFERYNFSENNAYEYFIYVTSLLNGGEEKNSVLNKEKTRSYQVATKEDSSIFMSSMTPLEKLVVFSELKGLLSGSYEFKYKRDVTLTSFSLPDYNKEDYLKWLDNKIDNAKKDLLEENTKISGRKR
mgnify:CR=1 FL=1